MIYGKLIDGNIVFAPNPIIIENRQIGNPPGGVYAEYGYKPMIFTDPPQIEPGYITVPGWIETEDKIVQTWTVELAPNSEEEALVRYSNELTGASDNTLEEATETLIKNAMEVN